MAQSDFEAAVKFVQSSGPVKLSNETKLAFYSLFKQVSQGPCKDKAPSRLKVIEYTKWKAYSGLGNMSKEEAMKQYVAALTKAVPNWNAAKAKL